MSLVGWVLRFCWLIHSGNYCMNTRKSIFGSSGSRDSSFVCKVTSCNGSAVGGTVLSILSCGSHWSWVETRWRVVLLIFRFSWSRRGRTWCWLWCDRCCYRFWDRWLRWFNFCCRSVCGRRDAYWFFVCFWRSLWGLRVCVLRLVWRDWGVFCVWGGLLSWGAFLWVYNIFLLDTPFSRGKLVC